MKSDHGHNPSSPAESHWPWITLALLGIVAVGLFLAWKTGVFNPLVVWAYRMRHGFVRDFTRLIRTKTGKRRKRANSTGRPPVSPRWLPHGDRVFAAFSMPSARGTARR